jgi:hypothetical protein
MLESRNQDDEGGDLGLTGVMANAGLAVEKDGEVRLTCPAHLFEGIKSKVCFHGNRIVGELQETLGEDIGLLDAVVPLSNEFLSIDCIGRQLVRSNQVSDDDIIRVDSCFTGPQPMLFAGSRTGKRKRRRGPGPSWPHWYVVFEQGIYTTSDPCVPKPPIVREGMCGTPLLRVGNKRDKSVGAVGDVLGFFLWADVKGGNGNFLYSYGQPTDPLIDGGWRVADVDYNGKVSCGFGEAEWVVR